MAPGVPDRQLYSVVVQNKPGAPLGLGLKEDFFGRVVVEFVVDQSPAQQSGLKPNDRILRVHGALVPNLAGAKALFSAQSPVEITISRQIEDGPTSDQAIGMTGLGGASCAALAIVVGGAPIAALGAGLAAIGVAAVLLVNQS